MSKIKPNALRKRSPEYYRKLVALNPHLLRPLTPEEIEARAAAVETEALPNVEDLDNSVWVTIDEAIKAYGYCATTIRKYGQKGLIRTVQAVSNDKKVPRRACLVYSVKDIKKLSQNVKPKGSYNKKTKHKNG